MNIKKPRITVLMSAYNAEKYIKEAIESILNQSFTDFEFIIIDDTSTDKTLEIIKSFDDVRIKIITNKENLGLTKSLNIGIVESKGKYIARLDADDIALPKRLEKQYEFMENNLDIVLVGGKIEIINEYGKLISIKKAEVNPIRIKFEIIFRNPLFHSTIFFRKKTIMNNGGYSGQLKNVEDYDLYSKLIKKYKISNLDDILIKFRCHNNSITTTSNSQKIMHKNALKIIYTNINNYVPITLEKFNKIKNLLVVKGDDKKKKLKTLIKANKLVNKIFKSFIIKEKLTTKEIEIIKPYYNELKIIMLKRYLINLKKKYGN